MCSNAVEGGADREEHLGFHHVVHEVILQLDCDILRQGMLISDLIKFLSFLHLHCAILHLGNVVKACPVLLTVSSMEYNVMYRFYVCSTALYRYNIDNIDIDIM